MCPVCVRVDGVCVRVGGVGVYGIVRCFNVFEEYLMIVGVSHVLQWLISSNPTYHGTKNINDEKRAVM